MKRSNSFQSFNQKQFQNFKNIFKINEIEGSIEVELYKNTINGIRFIKWIPGLQMIGVGNSLSMNCAKKSSDIDLLIVTSSNRLWFVRTLITLIFSLLGIRKTDKKHAGQLCLSFFCTTEVLNFGNFSIDNDIYLYFWILYFKPILNYNDTYETFIKENKKWANFSEYEDMFQKNKTYIKYSKNTGTKQWNFLTIVNTLLKKMLITKALKSYKKLGKPYGIIINDHMLKFHNNDIRKKIKDELI